MWALFPFSTNVHYFFCNLRLGVLFFHLEYFSQVSLGPSERLEIALSRRFNKDISDHGCILHRCKVLEHVEDSGSSATLKVQFLVFISTDKGLVDPVALHTHNEVSHIEDAQEDTEAEHALSLQPGDLCKFLLAGIHPRSVPVEEPILRVISPNANDCQQKEPLLKDMGDWVHERFIAEGAIFSIEADEKGNPPHDVERDENALVPE